MTSLVNFIRLLQKRQRPMENAMKSVSRYESQVTCMSSAGEAQTRPSLSLRLAGPDADQSAEEAGPLRTSLALELGCASNTAGHTVDLSLPFQEQRWALGAH